MHIRKERTVNTSELNIIIRGENGALIHGRWQRVRQRAPLFRSRDLSRVHPPPPHFSSSLDSKDETQTPGTVARVSSSDLRDFFPSRLLSFRPSLPPFFPLSPFSVSSPHLTRITCPVAYSRRYFGLSARSAIRSMSSATKAFCSGRRMLVAPINSTSSSSSSRGFRKRRPRSAVPRIFAAVCRGTHAASRIHVARGRLNLTKGVQHARSMKKRSFSTLLSHFFLAWDIWSDWYEITASSFLATRW